MFGEDSDDGYDYNDHYNNQAEGYTGVEEMRRRDYMREEKKELRSVNGTLLIVWAFSLLIIIDVVKLADEPAGVTNAGAAIIISVFSLVLTTLKYCHAVCVEEMFSACFEVGYGISLLILWIAGLIHLTFSQNGAFNLLLSSGFFASWVCLLASGHYLMSVWGHVSEDNPNSGCGFCNCCGLMSFKKGVTPVLGVALILMSGLILATFLAVNDGKGGGAAVFTLVFAFPSMVLILSMVCVPLKGYGNPDRFLAIMTFMIGVNVLTILFTTFGAPFAERGVAPDGGTGPRPFEVAGNGFFAVIGLFGTYVIMFWSAHKVILMFNSDNSTGFGVQGRNIWLGFLGIGSTILVVATVVECGEFGGCDENVLLSPLLGAAVCQMFLAPVVFCVCKSNEDLGDLMYINPGDTVEYFRDNAQRIEFIAAVVFQIAWLAAAAVFTFSVDSPFNTASTGYFFIWFNFFFASFYFNAVVPTFGLFSLSCLEAEPPNGMSRRNNFGIALVIFGCIVQAAAVGSGCVERKGCESEDYITFGLEGAAALISLLLLVCTPSRLGIVALILSYLLMGLCYGLLVTSTIVIGPFEVVAGNGFFAAWGIVFGAYYNLNHYEWKFNEL